MFCRHHFFLFGAILLLYFVYSFLKDRQNKTALISGACLLAGLMMILSPITLRNIIIGKDFVISNYNASYSFYSGNSPDYEKMVDGGYDISNFLGWEYAIREPYREAGHWLRCSEYSKYFYKKAFKFIAEHPIRWMKLMVKKFYVFWSGFERVEIGNYIYSYFEYSPLLAFLVGGKWIYYPFGIIGPLSIIGMALSTKNNWKTMLLTVMAISCMVLDILQTSSPRYRIAVVPFLIISASYTLYWWLQNIRDKRWTKDLFLSVTFFLILVPLCNIPPLTPLTPTSKAVIALKKAWGYVRAKDTPKAIEEMEKSIEFYPEKADYRLYKQLAGLYAKEKKTDKAIFTYERAIKVYPDDFQIRIDLAKFLEGKGKTDRAISEYNAAIDSKKLGPKSYIDSCYSVGMLYSRKKDYKSAIKAFNSVVSRGKNDKRYRQDVINARYKLIEIYEMTAAYDKAVSEYKELSKLDPNNYLLKERAKELSGKQPDPKPAPPKR
jgi:Tfp pilus assembly protein PilF